MSTDLENLQLLFGQIETFQKEWSDKKEKMNVPTNGANKILWENIEKIIAALVLKRGSFETQISKALAEGTLQFSSAMECYRALQSLQTKED